MIFTIVRGNMKTTIKTGSVDGVVTAAKQKFKLPDDNYKVNK